MCALKDGFLQKTTPEQRSGVVHIVEVRYTLQGL